MNNVKKSIRCKIYHLRIYETKNLKFMYLSQILKSDNQI